MSDGEARIYFYSQREDDYIGFRLIKYFSNLYSVYEYEYYE